MKPARAKHQGTLIAGLDLEMRGATLPRALVALSLVLPACHEPGEVEVTAVEIRGTDAVSARGLREILATQASSRLLWSPRRYLDREQLEADLQRIRLFYRDRGYPGARVVSFDVDLNEAGDEASITIVIDEGPPLLIERVEWQGLDAVLPEAADAARRAVPLEPGDVRDARVVRDGRARAADELADRGYPYGRIEVGESPGRADGLVVLTFSVTPGPRATVARIEIAGHERISDEVIRRQLTFAPGELYRASRLAESQRRLRRLELFDFVNVAPETGGPEQAAAVPVRVTVAEGRHRRVMLSAGYGTEEKVRAQADLRHLNLLGGARSLGVETKWSSLDRGLRLNYGQPYLLTRYLAFGAQGEYWFENEPAYRLSSRGGRPTVGWWRDRRDASTETGAETSLSATFMNDYTAYRVSEAAMQDETFRTHLIALGLDPETGEGRGTLRALRLQWRRNTTLNPLDARRGSVAEVVVEQAGRVLPADFSYVELSAGARHYLDLAGRAVLAHRLRLASFDSDEGVPFFKRYFLGGSTSLRGWGRYEVGPLTESGFPLGGFSLLEATSEARVPVTESVGIVVFLDAGNVWPHVWRFPLGDLRANAGVGLRYLTPLGPVRFDFARQLTPVDGLRVDGRPETRHWRTHVSLGQAF